MKKAVAIAVIGLVLALVISSNGVCDRGDGHGGGHFHDGGHFGGRGFYGGFYGGYFGFPYSYPYGYYPYGYPYAYPYAPYGYPYAEPPVYTEPPVTYSAPEQSNYWYFCKDAQAYYPYVQSCPGGWVRVVPNRPQP